MSDIPADARLSLKQYLVLAEGLSHDHVAAKTGRGIMRYGLVPVVAVLDSTRAGQYEDAIPIVATIREALVHGANTAVVGVAPPGGRFGDQWRLLLRECILNGLDIESGLHDFIEDDPELSRLAAEMNVSLRDLRKPGKDFDVASGRNLALHAQTVLTIGSDCAIGKMTVALELDRAARKRGYKSQFVATGQTGIAIAGWGTAVDAVLADFIAGAAEQLVVDAEARGGELLIVEGQGALTHPAYSGVSLGLMHGSAPHVLVLCHRVGASEHEGFPGHLFPSLAELIALHELVSLPARKAKVAAIALDTHSCSNDDAVRAIAAVAEQTGLVTDDPVRFGPERLLDGVLQHLPKTLVPELATLS